MGVYLIGVHLHACISWAGYLMGGVPPWSVASPSQLLVVAGVAFLILALSATLAVLAPYYPR